MRAINIEWDVADEDMTQEEMDEILETLPTEVEIPNYLAEEYEDGYEDDISDWLSDEFGFCVCEFEIEE